MGKAELRTQPRDIDACTGIDVAWSLTLEKLRSAGLAVTFGSGKLRVADFSIQIAVCRPQDPALALAGWRRRSTSGYRLDAASPTLNSQLGSARRPRLPA